CRTPDVDDTSACGQVSPYQAAVPGSTATSDSTDGDVATSNRTFPATEPGTAPTPSTSPRRKRSAIRVCSAAGDASSSRTVAASPGLRKSTGVVTPGKVTSNNRLGSAGSGVYTPSSRACGSRF